MKKNFPFAHSLFLRIAEPRIVRLMQFGVYISMFASGIGLLTEPPHAFKSVIGVGLVFVFGGFITLGSILGATAVLPGIWWLERVGLIALATGLAMYIVILASVSLSLVGFSIAIALIFTFIQRWREIKGAQLAPREE